MYFCRVNSFPDDAHFLPFLAGSFGRGSCGSDMNRRQTIVLNFCNYCVVRWVFSNGWFLYFSGQWFHLRNKIFAAHYTTTFVKDF